MTTHQDHRRVSERMRLAYSWTLRREPADHTVRFEFLSVELTMNFSKFIVGEQSLFFSPFGPNYSHNYVTMFRSDAAKI